MLHFFIKKFKFAGGSSDSGGGFTKKAMKDALIVEKLADPLEYIHVNCTEHNDQTALRSACNKVYGTGGVDNRNILQLIHAFADVQKAHEGTAQLIPRMKSEFIHLRKTQPPLAFLKLMQEPILTRWKTVGEACRYIHNYLDVLVSLCESLCKMKGTAANSQIGKCASDFLSLAKHEEIIIDLAFLSDFDKEFFQNHMEFNRFTDKHIGSSGFIAHHHLGKYFYIMLIRMHGIKLLLIFLLLPPQFVSIVRYFVKISELEELKRELENGSMESSLVNPTLKKFWKKLMELKEEKSLKKARLFIDEYIKSVHKHNEQFLLPELLFLACFGEHATSTLVAKMFFEEEDGEPSGIFDSAFHKKKIDLQRFHQFLLEKCRDAIPEAKTTANFDLMKLSIRVVANGRNIWDGSPIMEPHRNLFLENFGAIPSTSVWVERAVKKAKLCKRTGNDEKNVTAYCIAGDNLTVKCSEQSVASSYANQMSKKRKLSQEAAVCDGREARCMDDYEEDITRGRSLTEDIVNHALKLYDDILKMKQDIGEALYKDLYERTYAMLTQIPLQGSYIRYSEELATLQASRYKEHVAFARERLEGVDDTPLMEGKIPFAQLLKDNNINQMMDECTARGIQLQDETGKMILWTKMKNAIQEQERMEWIAAHPGKKPPDNIKQHFMQLSNATFIWKDE